MDVSFNVYNLDPYLWFVHDVIVEPSPQPHANADWYPSPAAAQERSAQTVSQTYHDIEPLKALNIDTTA